MSSIFGAKAVIELGFCLFGGFATLDCFIVYSFALPFFSQGLEENLSRKEPCQSQIYKA